MTRTVVVALIAAVPWCLAAIFAFLGNRSLKRSIGYPTSIPLSRVVEGVSLKIDRLFDGQTEIREHLARLEGERPHYSRARGSR